MATAVEGIINQALRGTGLRFRIADIYEGSPPARAALEIYGQSRDELLRAQDWPFARSGPVALALLKGPPPPGGYYPGNPWTMIFPAQPWLYEYGYPSDCLDLLAILKPAMSLPQLDPRAQTWRVDNDLMPIVSGSPPTASGPAQKVILANAKGALAIYRRRVTNPALWEPGFTATLIESLARKLALTLTQNLQVMQALGQETGAVATAADQKRG